MTLIDWLMAILLVTIAISFAAGLLAWRARPEPGADPLVLLLSGEVWWSAFLVFELQAGTLSQKVLWSNIQWVGVVLIPVAWLLFALEYTGRDRYVQPHVVAVLMVIPVITILFALTEQFHNILYLDATTVTYDGMSFLSRDPGPWYWVTAAYTYLLGGLGIIPLLELLLRSDTAMFRGQSTALIIGLVSPWATNILFILGAVPIAEFDPTPIAFAIAGVAYLGALTRFRLFGTSPAPNRRARRLVFERMGDGAIVIDAKNYVVDMNERAEDMLGRSRRDVIGEKIENFLPSLSALTEEVESPANISVETPTGERHFDISDTEIYDIHDRLIGRVITFHDIGEYLRQQQRLEVLNRVFRHNIRTDTQVITGYADQLVDDNDGAERDGESSAASILKERAENIANLGEKARVTVNLFDQERGATRSESVAELLETTLDRLRDAYPDVCVRLPDIHGEYRVSSVLEPVIWNILENAAEHNTNPDPTITIALNPQGERIRIRIADNGPGLNENEYAVLEEGTETSLEHASGIGLWLIYWGTTIADGRVLFEENEPTGTIVTVDVPLQAGQTE